MQISDSIKSIPQHYRYLLIIVFLLGVELIWLTPAIAIDSTTQTLPQDVAEDETDEADTIAADTTDKEDTNNSLFDSGAPPKTNISLTPDLYFGARFELEFQTEKDFDFDTENAEDISTLESILSLAFLYTPTRNFSAFLNIDPSQALVVDQRDKKKDKTRLEVIQAYLSFKKVIGDLDIRVGRQRFKDKREWLYDEELDGIRFLYNFPKASVELSASEKKHKDLINEGDDEKITNYVLYGKYALNKKTNIAAYAFTRDDSRTAQEKLIFYGLQLNGKHNFNLNNKITNKLNYWLELAHVEDKSESNKISASGFDIGATYRFGYPLKPAVTFAYAYGSGDADPSDNIDKNFRQTGLQDNDAKFNGIVRMKYYGEMFDPELSNLIVQTVGFGIWPTKRMSVDLVYHNYRQDELSNNIRDSEIDLDPSGLSKKLGQEFDLVVGFRGEERRSKISFILGYFVPGSAFPTANNARFVEIKYKRKF